MSKSIKKREFQIFKIWPNCQAFAFAFCASLKIVNLFSEFVVKFGQMIVNCESNFKKYIHTLQVKEFF